MMPQLWDESRYELAHQRKDGSLNINCLSYWFPKIAAAGLPVPRTEIVEIDEAATADIWSALDGNQLTDASAPFFVRLAGAAEKMGYPCFIRTGHTSAKHHWKATCYLESREDIRSHVVEIALFSEMASLVGADWSVWAIRELLPTKPLMIADRYSDMPMCREFRVFVNNGDIECWHPYWPKESVLQGLSELLSDFNERYEKLVGASELEGIQMQTLAGLAGRAVGGRWSVDILDTARGWYVTDMAEADKSFHWEGCK